MDNVDLSHSTSLASWSMSPLPEHDLESNVDYFSFSFETPQPQTMAPSQKRSTQSSPSSKSDSKRISEIPKILPRNQTLKEQSRAKFCPFCSHDIEFLLRPVSSIPCLVAAISDESRLPSATILSSTKKLKRNVKPETLQILSLWREVCREKTACNKVVRKTHPLYGEIKSEFDKRNKGDLSKVKVELEDGQIAEDVSLFPKLE